MSRAKLNYNEAFVDTEFGESIARKWFGDEVVDSLPEYVRGKRKGKKKGVVTWNKIVRGGWINQGVDGDGYVGYVENRVGQCIDKKLHNLESSQYGRHAGEVIVRGSLEEQRKEAENRRQEEISIVKSRIEGDTELLDKKQEQIKALKSLNDSTFDRMIKELEADIYELNEDIEADKKYLSTL